MFFFENGQGLITLEAPDYIRLYWLPASLKEGTRLLLTQLLRAQLQSGCTHLLLDTRYAGPLSPGDQVWLLEEWLPQAVRLTGPHYVAHLPADDVIARLSRRPIMEKARQLGALQQGFRHEAEALRWLAQQPA